MLIKDHHLQLIGVLSEAPFESYHRHSRIHPLKGFSSPACKAYVKRDDELAFSVSGTKIRKYLSLIPSLIQEDVEEVLLIGGSHSNNVLGLAQLLKEKGITPLPLLRRPANDKLMGNLLFLNMIIPEEDIHWIERNQWHDVENIAYKLAQSRERKTFVVPEGALLPQSLPGALTLSADVIANEGECGVTFDHIFVDSGTALQAIALILGHSWVGHPATIHVVLLADDEEVFHKKLETFHQHFDEIIGTRSVYPSNFTLHTPAVAPSFGAVNKEVLQGVVHIAREEGFFLDPIYSAKLFLTGKKRIEEGGINGNVLFIHSGGALSLSGFQDRIAKMLVT